MLGAEGEPARRRTREQKETEKQERKAQAASNRAVAREQAISDHERNFAKLEAVLPLLTDDVLAFAATLRHPFGGLGPPYTRLDYVTKTVQLASGAPPDLADEYTTTGDFKRWAKFPLDAAKEISALARGEVLPVKW